MRVKILALPPLPDRRLVLALADDEAVADLAARAAAALGWSDPQGLVLEVDGFELLHESTGVIEAGDVVTVRPRRKRKASTDESPRKRARADAGAAVAAGVPLPPSPGAGDESSSSSSSEEEEGEEGGEGEEDMDVDASSELSSSSSSSVSSSSESSTDSDSSSDSDSESDTSSSSSSSNSPPAAAPALRPPTFPAFPVLLKETGVPPGQGKPSTHERNARRRRARRAEKEAEVAAAATATAVAASSSRPGNASASPHPPTDAVSATTPQVVPGTNRNKKRGFMREMAGATGTKIVFADGEPVQVVAAQVGEVGEVGGSAVGSTVRVQGAALPLGVHTLQTETQTPTQTQTQTPTQAPTQATPTPTPTPTQPQRQPQTPQPDTPRSIPPTPIRVPEAEPRALVPPSERTILPNNVFVTSRVFDFIPDHERRRRDAHHAARERKERERWEVERGQGREVHEVEMGQETEVGQVGQEVGEMSAQAGQVEETEEREGNEGEKAKDADKAEAKASQQANGPSGHAPTDASGVTAEKVNGTDKVPTTDPTAAAFWTHVDAGFDTLPEIEGDVRVGMLVAWKDVVLDLTTFTPQLVVLVARVVGLAGRRARLRCLKRVWEGEGEGEGGGDEGEVEEDEEEEEEEIELDAAELVGRRVV